MKIIKQSPSLRETFKERIDEKVSSKRQATQEALGGGFWGQVGGVAFDIYQMRNELQGRMGEQIVSLLLSNLPDSWVLFQNALIPSDRPGILTEIDHLIIGPGGVFLAEIKTWKGSFSAYKDNWKRREGYSWQRISNSPTSQSAYHQKMFVRWMNSEMSNFPSDRVLAPVVFTVAKWLGTKECSVPVVRGAMAFLDMLLNSPHCLTSEEVLRISSLIENYTIPEQTETSTPVSKPILKNKEREREKKSLIKPGAFDVGKKNNSPLPTRKIEKQPIKLKSIPKTNNNNSPVSGVIRQAIDDLTKWLQNLPQTLKLENVENNAGYQKKGVDLLLMTNKGEFKLAIAGDKWHKTGNFFFETYSNKEENKPGNFMYYEVDWLLYYFITPRTLYMLPMPKTRDWFVANIEQFTERSTKSSNKNSTTVGRLVPIETVIKEIEEVRKHQL